MRPYPRRLGGYLGPCGAAAVVGGLWLLATPAPAKQPPVVLDTNVVNVDRTMVSLTGTILLGVQSSVSIRIHGLTPETDTLLSRVPDDKKLVLTDFLVHHNINGASDVLGANFRFSATLCEEGTRTIFQLRVGPGAGTNLSLTTGFEVPPSQELCFATGGDSATPNLGLSFTVLGYLTSAT